MSLVAVKLGANVGDFTGGIDAALKSMQQFEEIAQRTQRAAENLALKSPAMSTAQPATQTSDGTAGTAEAGQDMAAVGMQAQAQAGAIRAAMTSAIAPIGMIQNKIGEMVNRAGGAMVTLARRIDASMRFEKYIKRVDNVNKALGAPFNTVNKAISSLEQRFNVFGPTTGAAFGVIQDKVIEWRNKLDRTFRFDDLIGKWIGFVGTLRKANQPFTDRAAITGIQLMGAGILTIVGKGVPALLRLRVTGYKALVQLPLAAYAGWKRLRNTIGPVGDVARKSLSKLFTLPVTAPIAAVKQFNSSLATVSPTASKAGASIASFGKQVLVAFGFFGLAYKAVEFLKQGMMGASDLNETVNKTGLIFGDQAGIVGKAADDMASKFGVVKADFMNTADSFGQLLQGMGKQSKTAAATTSVNLTKLAADASSLFNVSFEEASAKMQAALRGQSEPISEFGIDVQEAAVKAEALRMGISGASGELTTAQKVAARTSLIMRGLAVAEGDLANTAEAPANAMRRFQGTMTNLATDIGSLFLPALQAGLAALNEFASLLTEGFASAKEVVGDFAAKVTTAMETVGVLFRNLPLVWDIVVLKFQEGTSNMLAYIGTIPANLAIIADYIGNNWSELITDHVRRVGTVFMNLGTNIKNLFFAIQDLFAGNGFNFDWTPLLEGFKATAAEFPELIKPELVSMQNEIDAAAAKIAANEAARAAKMKKATPKLAPGPLEAKDAATAHEVKFAGAVELGSAEARTTLLNQQGRSNDPIKDVAKTNEKQVDLQQKMLDELRRRNGKPPEQKKPVFQF